MRKCAEDFLQIRRIFPKKKLLCPSRVVKAVEISTATISRVNRCLTYGAGGYQLILGKTKFGDEISEGNP